MLMKKLCTLWRCANRYLTQGLIDRAMSKETKPEMTAEEIIESILESLGDPINIHNHAFEIRPYTVDHKTEWWIFHKEVASGEPLAQWLSEFATLHAQQIADKMVSERDDKLLQQRDELKEALAEQKRLYFSLFDEETSCMYCEAKIRRGSAIILCKECAENTEV